ncbi:MAG TPA: DNA primase [Caldisericia bacterium]|nr:DNA primase [Caldisericia bacterium]
MNLEEYVRQIKDQIDLLDFIGKHVALRKAGRNWLGLCPFHAEKTPSFTVSEEKGIFFCFGCRAGGDLISFVEKFEHLEFREAIEFLGDKAGLPPLEWSSDKLQHHTGPRDEIKAVLGFARDYYRQQYLKQSQAKNYMQQRGIQEAVADAYQLGFAPAHDPQFLEMLKKKGFDLALCHHVGLLLKDTHGNYYPYFRERILFPIISSGQNLIGFGGRALSDQVQPKYLNSPEHSLFQKGKHLFGLNQAKKEMKNDDQLIIVEGYMDVISLAQSGFSNVCASLGTAFTSDQAKLAFKHSSRLVLCYDNDHAGIQATRRAIDLVLAMKMICKAIVLPPTYKDPDDFIRQEGKDAWTKLCEEALMPLDFIWKDIWSHTQSKDPMAVENAISQILSKILENHDLLMSESILRQVALDTGISLKILNDRLQRFQKSSYQAKTSIVRKKRPVCNIPSEDGEKILLKALIEKNDPSFHQMVFSRISELDFGQKDHIKLFVFLKEEFNKVGYLLNKELLIRINDDDMKRLLSELFLIEESFYNDTAVLECMLKTEENKNRKQSIQQLSEQIIQAEKEGKLELSKQLREELKRIV